MLKETYLAVMKNLPEDAVPIVVTRTSWSPLAPSLELLNDYKENRISWCQYEERYREEMLNSDEAIEEMKQILQERAAHAFFSIESGVIALAANHAVNKGSDVRVGLECLLKAGRVAEQENSGKVKVEHVKKVMMDVVKVKPKILKENLNDIEKVILMVLDENKELSFGELYKKYCESVGEAVTEKPFLNYVRHLDELKLLEWKKRKVNGKRIIGKA